ncbi:MAG: Ig domain-containing protein [Clostridia bacterium]|nr:Ig domain-containing protein [Clostridia bacterium]
MQKTCKTLFILSLIIAILCCIALPSYDAYCRENILNYPEEQPDTTPIPPTNIEINYEHVRFEKGQSIVLRPIITPYNATTNITWESSDISVATISIDNDLGSIRVYGNSIGSAYIYAYTSNGLTASCHVTILEPLVEPTNISLNYTSYSLKPGESFTLEAILYPTNTTLKSIAWTSLNGEIATVSDGVVTGISPGNVRIRAQTLNGLTAYCNVIVKPE